MNCKCCEVLKAQVEHQQKWIDRLMEDKSPDPDPQVADPLPELGNPKDELGDVQKFGE